MKYSLLNHRPGKYLPVMLAAAVLRRCAAAVWHIASPPRAGVPAVAAASASAVCRCCWPERMVMLLLLLASQTRDTAHEHSAVERRGLVQQGNSGRRGKNRLTALLLLPARWVLTRNTGNQYSGQSRRSSPSILHYRQYSIGLVCLPCTTITSSPRDASPLDGHAHNLMTSAVQQSVCTWF